MKIKFIKKVGEYNVGDIVSAPENEAKYIIESGDAVEEKQPMSLNDAKALAQEAMKTQLQTSSPQLPTEPIKIEDEAATAQKDKNTITILDIFAPGELTETTEGYKTECPDCGLQGGRTEGFIIFPKSNSSYCHSSGKHFTMLETYALKKKIIRCLDGRETGDNKSKILGGELFTLTLDEFKNEFGIDKYNKLIEQLNIRKLIQLPGNGRLVSDFCAEMGDVYKSRNNLFIRGGTGDVVEIDRNKKINECGETIIERGFKKTEADSFVTLAEKFIKPWTYLTKKDGSKIEVIRSMTQTHANLILASQDFKRNLPALERIFDIQIPIIFKKQLTFPKKGYDKRFGSWLPYNAPQIKRDLYTLDDAKTMLNKIFEEFCFAAEKDRIHAIAAFITPFMRGLFPEFCTRTPVFIYMANRERAGKDYCAGCSGMLYEGINVEQPPISNDEQGMSNANDEIRKKITACLRQGRKRFHSANNKGLLNNSVFEMVTTSPIWEDRILGESTVVTYNNEMDYSLSGNLGIRLTPDLANRARIINLHLVDEDANARIFKNPKLHQWIFDNRVFIISALYKLVENWVERGMPAGTQPFTSFPEWAKIVGGIMETAGYANPCEKDNTAIMSLDADTEEMKQLFESCYLQYPNQWIDKKTMVEIIKSEGLMPSLDFDNRSDQTKFALKIDKFVNRVLSDILMKVDSLEQRAARRKYIFESIKSPISSINPAKLVTSDKLVTFYIEPLQASDAFIANKGKLPTCPQVTNNTRFIQDLSNLPQDLNIPQSEDLKTTESPKVETLADITKKGQEYLKKEADKIAAKFIKEKTSRELQFFEDPQCASIVAHCTKEQVLEWIKTNPKIHFSKLDEALGLGCFKHIGDLVNEGVIVAAGEGWEVRG